MQSALFPSRDKAPRVHQLGRGLHGGTLREFPHAFSPAESARLLKTLLEDIPWRQDTLRIAGREIPVPRLQYWMGEPEAAYSYSGISLEPAPWRAAVLDIKSRVESLSGERFNSALLNYYRNGRDSVSWHADDEAALGPRPVIASVSFGATRKFQLRPKRERNEKNKKNKRNGGKFQMELHDGSLLLMGNTVQTHWQHQLPKMPGLEKPRINLTFRWIC